MCGCRRHPAFVYEADLRDIVGDVLGKKLLARSVRVLPLEIDALVCECDRTAWIAALGSAPLLLFPLDDPYGDLASGLTASASLDGDVIEPRHTEATRTRTALRASDPPPSMPRLKRARPLTSRSVCKLLSGERHFAAPLRRRRLPDRPLVHQITLGRAEYNDLVVRDPTVSSVQAIFECLEEDKYYVGDVGSRNTTLLDEEPLGTRPARLYEGSTIEFGAVQAMVCDPGTLWDAVHALD